MTETVRASLARIASGELSSVQLVEQYLEELEKSESVIRAWQHLDKAYVLSEAKHLDDLQRSGQPLGALHGIPVGIKDIFNTDNMPTEFGSPIYRGHTPAANATTINQLKQAGAIIMGKTVTTEFAYMHPSVTTNPHNREHTPGGSSSGSAAAVAAGHIPLALGTQTNGSVIRPASFCGVYGHKPSRGIVSRGGVLQTATHLDHVGAFARDLGDLALLCDCIGSHDTSDPASFSSARPGMLDGYLAEATQPPRFIWFELDYRDRFSDDTVNAFDTLLSKMGGQLERVAAPASFATLPAAHKTIYDYEIYRCLSQEREQHWSLLSPTAQAAMDAAASRSESEYTEALATRESAIQWFAEFFEDNDVIVTPAATGEAPLFEAGTGDPICCTIWTLCGLPALTLPVLTGSNNLPIGVQLVGAYNQDDRLFSNARWLLNHLTAHG